MYRLGNILCALPFILLGILLGASSLHAQVDRTTDQITLVESRTLNLNTSSWEVNFYRNNAYTCTDCTTCCIATLRQVEIWCV